MMEPGLVLVGGGFRATTFLASAPELLSHRVAVFERGTSFGPGGFADYAITSTSIGSRFLKELSATGPFSALRDDPLVARVADAEAPVPMAHLAAALGRVGTAVAAALGPDGLSLGTEVTGIDVVEEGSAVLVRLADGRTVRSRNAVIATGRTERPHAELAPWRAKVRRSAQIISRSGRDALRRELAALGRPGEDGGRIVIAGASHSAMSVLRVLLELFDEIRATDPGYRPPAVDVLQRSAARLVHPGLAEARRDYVEGRERAADPATDVCPETGIVFRDSGLRHESRDLYCALWDGRVPGARLIRTGRLAEAADLLDDAALVVQALGYHGHAPDVLVDGRPARPSGSPERFAHTDDGTALIAGRPVPALSVLRVEPTPYALRDHAVYGSGLYGRLAGRLLARLGADAGPLAATASAAVAASVPTPPSPSLPLESAV
ncbi:hypothetical protein ACIRBY_15730 [Streptomyces sp. NPDC096136]|uniref:hypothetical protein n=1 Tax=Streptomyces sp. NPDC096136 TaxID=3366076 RepID=UPI00382BC40B